MRVGLLLTDRAAPQQAWLWILRFIESGAGHSVRERSTQDLFGKGREISGKSLMGCCHVSIWAFSLWWCGYAVSVLRWTSLRRLGVAVR